MNDPNRRAGWAKRTALSIRTGVEIGPHVHLPNWFADELLTALDVGQAQRVRSELVDRGGVPTRGLQGPEEVRIVNKFGCTMLGLPHGVEVPDDAPLTVKHTAEGHLLIEW